MNPNERSRPMSAASRSVEPAPTMQPSAPPSSNAPSCGPATGERDAALADLRRAIEVQEWMNQRPQLEGALAFAIEIFTIIGAYEEAAVLVGAARVRCAHSTARHDTTTRTSPAQRQPDPGSTRRPLRRIRHARRLDVVRRAGRLVTHRARPALRSLSYSGLLPRRTDKSAQWLRPRVDAKCSLREALVFLGRNWAAGGCEVMAVDEQR